MTSQRTPDCENPFSAFTATLRAYLPGSFDVTVCAGMRGAPRCDGRAAVRRHHLQSQSRWLAIRAARWWTLTGQCSPGARALSRVGHPQPSITGSRSSLSSSGVPQYDTPRRTTRSGQRSQIAARAAQWGATAASPSVRQRAAACLAAPRQSVASDRMHEKQPMQSISGRMADGGERDGAKKKKPSAVAGKVSSCFGASNLEPGPKR